MSIVPTPPSIRPITHRVRLMLLPDDKRRRWAWGVEINGLHYGDVDTSASRAAAQAVAYVDDTLGAGAVLVILHGGGSGVHADLGLALQGTRHSLLAASEWLPRTDRLGRFTRDVAPWCTDTDEPATPARGTIIACDASLRRAEAGPASWAWVCSNGTWATGLLDTDLIHVAETHALLEAAAAAPQHTPVIILSDSTAALDAGAAMRDSGWSARPEQRRLVQELRLRRQLRLDWVPGHAGHPLNEAADRLARLARHSHLAGVVVNPVIAENIVTQMLAQLRAAEAAGVDLLVWSRPTQSIRKLTA